jgi:NADH-quinone oxidoreductase subunit B
MDKEKLDAYLDPLSGTGYALLTRASRLFNLPRLHSLWYLLFSPACCGIELMQTGGVRTDLDRFGMVFRATPRQSDLMIVGGTVTYKMAERVQLLYRQMAEPRYVIAMGACANCGGLFDRSYAVLKGVDLVVPVDIYIPGCPPRPEALVEGMRRIQSLIKGEDWGRTVRRRRPLEIGEAR